MEQRDSRARELSPVGLALWSVMAGTAGSYQRRPRRRQLDGRVRPREFARVVRYHSIGL
jgi:hypothetical protein